MSSRVDVSTRLPLLQRYDNLFNGTITKNSDFVRAFYLQLDALAAHGSLPRACVW
jgi:hypothetical protein